MSEETDISTDTAQTTIEIAEFLRSEDDPFPWASDPTGIEKTRLVTAAAILGDCPTDFVLFENVLEAEFDDDSRKHYDRSDGLTGRYPDLWEKKTESGHVMVRPTAKALYLIRACSPEEKVPWWEPIEAVDDGGNPLPVQRFDERLGWRRGSENGLNDSQLGLALDFIADHRSTLVDDEGGSKRLDSGAIPAVQRFGCASRANNLLENYKYHADELERRFESGVVLTLTLPRAVADSAVHSYEVMAGAWKRFKDKLRYDPKSADKPTRPGYVPPYVWVQEPHRDGWAHRHIVFGGVRHLMDATDIHDDWADCLDIPNCADVTPWIHLAEIRFTDGWHVVGSNDAEPAVMKPADTPPMAVADGGTVVPARYEDAGGLRPYYRKSMNRLNKVASLSVPQICERAEQLGDKTAEGAKERNREMALLSFMWASEAPFTGAADRLEGQ